MTMTTGNLQSLLMLSTDQSLDGQFQTMSDSPDMKLEDLPMEISAEEEFTQLLNANLLNTDVVDNQEALQINGLPERKPAPCPLPTQRRVDNVIKPYQVC